MATGNTNNIGERRRALVIRLYKKFPHLFKKASNTHNPKTFFLSQSATLENMEEAFRFLKLSDSSTDLVAFKKFFSLYKETATKRNVTPWMHSRSRNNHGRMDESLFPSKNVTVNHLKVDEEIASSDDMESVRFDFGDDYGSRWEFAELGKELAFGYEWCPRVSRREFKDSKNIAKDVYKLSSQEEMLKEFAENYRF